MMHHLHEGPLQNLVNEDQLPKKRQTPMTMVQKTEKVQLLLQSQKQQLDHQGREVLQLDLLELIKVLRSPPQAQQR